MRLVEHRRIAVGGGVGLALGGLWIGHTVEYIRVWGAAGLSAELFGSIHAYMLPLAAVIALLAGLLGLRLWRMWDELGRRLDAAHAAVRALLRSRVVAVAEPSLLPRGAPSFWAGIAVAWPALAVVQVGFYVAQENIEAAAAGFPIPGLGAITGVHALAPLVHATVALVLLLAVRGTARLLRCRASAVIAIEAVARVLLRALRGRAPGVAAPHVPEVHAPLQLYGWQLRQRPPPAFLGI